MELFNLRHAGARNAIERIFGVVKRKGKILPHGCEYELGDQARLVYAIACLYNILRTWDAHERELVIDDTLPADSVVFRGQLRGEVDEEEGDDRRARGRGIEERAEDLGTMGVWRHSLAERMFQDYQRLQAARRRVND